MARSLILITAVIVLTLNAANASAQMPSVEDFFRNPEFTDMKLSPSGKYLATLAPVNGHRNVVVLETDGLKNIKPLTGLDDQDLSRVGELDVGGSYDVCSLGVTRKR